LRTKSEIIKEEIKPEIQIITKEEKNVHFATRLWCTLLRLRSFSRKGCYGSHCIDLFVLRK